MYMRYKSCLLQLTVDHCAKNNLFNFIQQTQHAESQRSQKLCSSHQVTLVNHVGVPPSGQTHRLTLNKA